MKQKKRVKGIGQRKEDKMKQRKADTRRENMRTQTEECFRKEIEEKRNRNRNENTGALRNARKPKNRVRRVNNLITEVNYQQHNCGG